MRLFCQTDSYLNTTFQDPALASQCDALTTTAALLFEAVAKNFTNYWAGQQKRQIELFHPTKLSDSELAAFGTQPASSAFSSFEGVDVAFPAQVENLDKALFPLHRQIERQYRALPWPAEMQKIVVLTHARGGQGDVAAAAKAIGLMQKLGPTLTFDWQLRSAATDKYDPMSFLNDPSRVLRHDSPPEKTPVDFLLTGPVKLGWDRNYLENYVISRKIAGPIFGFEENANEVYAFYPHWAQRKVEGASERASLHEIYQAIHSYVFPSQLVDPMTYDIGSLPMGLQPGSGVFLDESRIKAPLSRGYCCPSYLLQIQDPELRSDILEAMDVFDGQSEPDYDRHSFNSGYAHHPVSWGKFIDAVAIHEKTKHVVIILNQEGQFSNLSTQEFQDQIFTPDRLAFLKQKGIGTLRLKGQGQNTTILQEAGDPQLDRRLTVIVRPSFIPNDIKQLQLASERLLATGDNSAAESWSARCKLYLYEEVGWKQKFFQQQVDLAQTISPTLGKLLALFGEGRRLPDSKINQPLSEENMAEMEQFLNDPSVSSATLQFCDHIIADYSFDQVLEGALKRAAWHHLIPKLANIEADALDEEFRSGLIAYLKYPEASEKPLRIHALPELGKRVQKAIEQYRSK